MESALPPYSPAAWDALVNQSDQPADLKDLLTHAPDVVRVRRELHIAMTLGRPEIIGEALATLDRYSDEAVRGMRLMAFVAMGEYSHVLATSDVPLLSLDPYVLEDACDAAFARGMAHAEGRDFLNARSQLLLALKLAEALGMRYRAQHIEMETGRVCTLMGNPDPQQIINAMARLPLSLRRRTWGTRVLAEALLSVGDYRSAAVHLAREELCDLGQFTAALLGTPSQNAPTAGAYAPVAAGLWALRLNEPFNAPVGSGTSPQAEYGVLLRAWAMLRTRSMAGQARNMLSALDVLSPDHRAHRAAALIQANAALQLGDDIDALITEFNTALGLMTVRDPFLALLRAIHPEAYVLLGMLPGIHSEVAETLPAIPILTGAAISYQYQVHKLPGKANGSPVIVMAAATGRTGPEARPHPQAAQRLREALGHLGATSYVNIGTVVRAVTTFRNSARLSRQPSWDAATERALSWIDSAALQGDVRRDLRL